MKISRASLTVIVRSTFFFGIKAPIVSLRSIPIWPYISLMPPPFFSSLTATVISRSSNKPFSNCSATLKRRLRISSVTSPPASASSPAGILPFCMPCNMLIISAMGLLFFSLRIAGTKILTSRLLASFSARTRTFLNCFSSSMATAVSARSRTIDSTSRPT